MDVVLGNIITSVVSSGALLWLTRTCLSERLRASIRAEYDQRLEELKRRLELEFEDEGRRRKLYEEMASSLESLFGQGALLEPKDISLTINKLFALLALYAPDDVYLTVKRAVLNKTVYGKDVKPVVYHAMRHSLFGDRTKLSVTDLVDHMDVTHIPGAKQEHLTDVPANTPVQPTGSARG